MLFCQQYKNLGPLLIFCLVDLSIGVSRVLKSPTIIVLLLISPFILVEINIQTQDGAAPVWSVTSANFRVSCDQKHGVSNQTIPYIGPAVDSGLISLFLDLSK